VEGAIAATYELPGVVPTDWEKSTALSDTGIRSRAHVIKALASGERSERSYAVSAGCRRRELYRKTIVSGT
jgi:hypothetical protein